jgi:hypothetical protein
MKSFTGVPTVADFMKSAQMGAAVVPPVCRDPKLWRAS